MEYNITYRQKDGGWQYIISYKEDGKWKQKSKQGFRTRGLAKIAADERLEKLRENFKIELAEGHDEITLKQFEEMFLSSLEIHRENNTIIAYKTAFKKIKKMDSFVVNNIMPMHIQNCVDDMVKEGLSANTVKQYIVIIKNLFRVAARKYKIIRENPVTEDLLLPIAEENEEIKALNKKDLDYILNNIVPEKDYIICLLAAYCGLRIGEIMGLCDSDIDFKKCEIDVNKQWKKIKDNEYGFGKVKSTSRPVPIPLSIIPILKRYLDSKIKYMDRRIFPDKRTDVVANRIRYKITKLGFDNSIHDLRHTYATRLVANRVDYQTISQYLGDTVPVIIKNYSHFTEDMKKAGAEKINQIF